MTNPPTDFLKYIGTPFESWILPIIPAGAELTKDSKLSPDKLGKIPGKWFPGPRKWAGFHEWQKHSTTQNDLQRWHSWQTPDVPIAIGMRTAELPVVDIDSDHPEIVEAICKLALEHLGWSPVRCREESPRRVLCYKWTPGPNRDRAPVQKMRLAFTDKEGRTHIVEILGRGQQVVIEGPHAKGKMHYWLDGKGLVDSYSELVDIAAAEAWRCVTAIRTWAEERGFTIVRPPLPIRKDRGPSIKIGKESPLLSSSMDLLARCVRAIDINDDRLADYDAWIKLLVAIKAACGGDQDFFLNTVWPWLADNGENADLGIEEMEAKWDSFSDSSLGADYVYDIASAFGFMEGKDTRTVEIFAGRPLPQASQGGDGGAQGLATPNTANSAMGGVQGGSGGPLPPNHTDRALADIAAARLAHERRYSNDQGWGRLKSGVWVKDDTILRPVGDICAEVGRPYRAQGPQQAQIDIMLSSARKIENVEKVMRSHPALYVDKEEFDSDPWLLNTPGGVWDMRVGTLTAHGALMRMQTAVTPNLLAYRNYEKACPNWMAYLNFIADGRPEVIPFLQRWGGYNFVGKIIGPHFLFIHGVPGTGKTVFVDIILRLGHTYGTPVSKQFFVRTNDKRTFELYQLFKKRMAIADETPKGSTWDEMMLLTMHNGSKLRAEGKGRDFIDFRNTATVTITGNHRPSFVTSSEASGIDRRLLVLTMNRKIADLMPDDEQFAEKLIAREGSAIMMWFMQGAQEGWESLDAGGSFLGDLAAPFKEAAKAYRRQANPFLQWIEEEMAEDPDKDINAKDAFAAFRAFMVDQNPKFHMSKPDFREGLRLATDGRVSYKMRSRQPNKGTMVFEGLTYKNENSLTDSSGNVVSFANR